MRIIEINALDNGAHDNQTIDGASPSTFPIPSGWAVIPDDMVCDNFPFGEVEVEKIDSVVIVTKWIPGIMPEPEFEEICNYTVEEAIANGLALYAEDLGADTNEK